MIRRKRRKITTQRKSNGNNKWFIISIFIIAQLIFLTSSVFQLKSINIVGDNNIAQSNLFEGLNSLVGKNIFMIRLADIKSQFKNNFWVKDISISYSFPGKLKIILNKKNAVALVSAPGVKGSWYEVTGEGNVLGINQEPVNLLKIIVNEDVKTGLKLNMEKILGAQKIYKMTPDSIKSKLNYIIIDSNGEYGLNGNFMGYDMDIKIGNTENLEYKMSLLVPVVNKLEDLKTDVSYVDLRYSQPIVKVK